MAHAENAAAHAEIGRLNAAADASDAAHARAMETSQAETAAARAEIGRLHNSADASAAAHAREMAAGRAEPV